MGCNFVGAGLRKSEAFVDLGAEIADVVNLEAAAVRNNDFVES